jgi:16S rRNA (guanine1207-N2)-methyltransferase
MGVVDLTHYYTKDNDRLESEKHPVRFVVKDHPFLMMTDKGVFSKSGLDFGTRVLLENLTLNANQTVLDLGCGYGPIGIVLTALYQSRVTMVDINQRAVNLTKENARLAKVEVEAIQSDGFEKIEGVFDVIVTNPPIRAGKKVIYGWYADSAKYLSENGTFYLVVNKNQGAPSTITELNRFYSKVDVVCKKSGYHLISCQK